MPWQVIEMKKNKIFKAELKICSFWGIDHRCCEELLNASSNVLFSIPNCPCFSKVWLMHSDQVPSILLCAAAESPPYPRLKDILSFPTAP